MKPFVTLVLMTAMISIYQTPQADTFFNKHDIQLGLSEKLPYGQEWQTSVETFKLSLSSIKYMSVEQTKALATVEPVKLPTTLTPTIETTIETSNVQKISTRNICTSNCTVVMLGDSMMGDVAMSYRRLLKKEHPDWKMVDMHKPSTGLSNKSYYDWPSVANQIIESKKPDYIYILIGMNDAQGIVSGKALMFGKDGWKNEYKTRVESMKTLFDRDFVSDWRWLEIPTVASETFNDKLKIVREVQKSALPEDKYLDVEPIIGTNRDTKKVDRKTRAGDGIHLNVNGSDAIAKYLASENKIN